MPNALPPLGSPLVLPTGSRPRRRGMVAVGAVLALTAGLLSGCADKPASSPRATGAVVGGNFAGDPWASHIAEASARFDVPETWIRAVMKVESGGRTHLNGRPITSRAGAMGLMQVMPLTYVEMRRKYGLGPDPHEPRDNILAGTAYLREMYDKFGSPGFLAAYNAGPGRYGEYLTGDRGLPLETTNYVNMIAPQIAGIHPSRRAPESMIAATLPPPAPRRTVLASARPVAAPVPAASPRVAASQMPVPRPAARPATAVTTAAGAQLAAAGEWGIQVGAFRSPVESNRAVEQARRSAPDLLTPARSHVVEVDTPSGRLYRARLIGVSPTVADRACARLASQGSACMTVAPEVS